MRPVSVGLGAGGESRIRLSPHGGTTPFRRGIRLSAHSGDEGLPSLKRGRAVRRSRRGALGRWLKPLAAALLLAAVPTAAVTWLMTSPRFAVGELAIVTGERVSETWVREALAPVLGENLLRLSLARAERIVRGHPWVRGASLRKDLPARLAVRVAERRAVALLRAGDGLHYLDSEGVRIAPFDPVAERGVDLPLISAGLRSLASEGTDRRPARPASPAASAAEERGPPAGPEPGTSAGLRSAVELLSEIDRVEPSWTAGLSEIEVLGGDDFRVHTAALPFPVLVKAGTLNQKARRLEELLPHIVERYSAAAVDLRFARRIIVKPSVESRVAPSRSGPATEHREARTDHAQRG